MQMQGYLCEEGEVSKIWLLKYIQDFLQQCIHPLGRGEKVIKRENTDLVGPFNRKKTSYSSNGRRTTPRSSHKHLLLSQLTPTVLTQRKT